MDSGPSESRSRQETKQDLVADWKGGGKKGGGRCDGLDEAP